MTNTGRAPWACATGPGSHASFDSSSFHCHLAATFKCALGVCPLPRDPVIRFVSPFPFSLASDIQYLPLTVPIAVRLDGPPVDDLVRRESIAATVAISIPNVAVVACLSLRNSVVLTLSPAKPTIESMYVYGECCLYGPLISFSLPGQQLSASRGAR